MATKSQYSKTLDKAADVTKAFIKIRGVSEGVVSLDTGRGQLDYRGVFRVDTINFSLLSKKEQTALIEGFKSFLNGISFLTQILVRNLPHDVRDLSYLSAVSDRGPLKEINEDQIAFIRYLASKRALVKRSFYIIVPADENRTIRSKAERLVNAQSQIALRMEEVVRQFERLGLSAERLGDAELVDFYQSCLTPKEPALTPSLLAGIDHLLAPADGEMQSDHRLPKSTSTEGTAHSVQLVKRKRSQRHKDISVADVGNLPELLTPSSIHMTPFYLRIDAESSHEYVRTLALTNYPRNAYPGWLDYIIQLDEPNLELSLFVQPLKPEQINQRLNRKAMEFRGSILVSERQGKTPDPTSTHALHDVEGLRDRLVRGDERVFSLSLFILVRGAASLRELDERTTRVQTAIRSLDFRALPLHWQHHLGLLSCLPYCENMLPRYARLMGTRAAATFYPFTGASPSMPRGSLLGILKNGSLVLADPFNTDEITNANMCVFGEPGSGKSFFLKTYLTRLAPRTRIYVLDLEGEYRLWGERVGAEHVSLTSESLQINPLDLYRQPLRRASYVNAQDEVKNFFREKLVNVVTFCSLLIGEQGMLSQKEKAFLYRCLKHAYSEKGISADPASHSRLAPSMLDLYRIMRAATSERDPYQVGIDQHGLNERLEQYLHLFPRRTLVDLDRSHVVFNIKELPESLKPVGTFLIVERLWTELRETRDAVEREKYRGNVELPLYTHSIICIDEAWFLTEFKDGADFLSEFARRIRKYGGGLWVGTQRSGDFLRSEQGKTLLAMCATKMLFKHDVASIGEVVETFHLNAGMSSFLQSARKGEALYIAKYATAIEVVASEKERVAANTTLGASVSPTPSPPPLSGNDALHKPTFFVPVRPDRREQHLLSPHT